MHLPHPVLHGAGFPGRKVKISLPHHQYLGVFSVYQIFVEDKKDGEEEEAVEMKKQVLYCL